MPSDSDTNEASDVKTPLRLQIFNFLGTPIFCVMWLMGRMLRVDWTLEAVKAGDTLRTERLSVALEAAIHEVLAGRLRLSDVESALRLVNRVIQEPTNTHDNSPVFVLPAKDRAKLADFVALLDKNPSEPTPDA